jgi:hypothetical protein
VKNPLMVRVLVRSGIVRNDSITVRRDSSKISGPKGIEERVLSAVEALKGSD